MELNLEQELDKIYETNKYNYKFLRFDRQPSEELVNYYVDNFNINTDCHYSCVTCQIDYINKYRDQLEILNEKTKSLTGQKLKKWFLIKCNFIPKGLSGINKDKFDALIESGVEKRRALRILLSTIDSAAWAELMIGFDDETKKEEIGEQFYLRWYQKHIIRCTADRKVLRQGRRSGKTAAVCVSLIDKVFNHKVYKGIDINTKEKIYGGPKIAIITPFQSQVSVIFEQLEDYIRRNKDLEKQIVQRGSKLYKQTPPMLMEFKNGASITGFVTGANNKEDGTAGGAIRGITGDIIYLDEMDMIPENIYKKVIEPLKLSKPQTYFIGSSTPIGKKATFYKWCKEDLKYKEFYVPSTALPHWELEEDQYLSESTGESFRAEYMADFIVDSYGVFKNPLIVAARMNYTYDQTNNPQFWLNEFGEDYYKFIKCIGVDWNKTVGTEFSVVAYSPSTGRYWTLENYLMPPTEYSSEGYKEKLKDLNFKWDPKYIYADEGYGHTILENLQLDSMYISKMREKTAFDISVAKIKDKLKIINFSSKLELFNRAVNHKFEKHAKSFLIENAVQIFEREAIGFSESDFSLIKQLGNYIEKEKKDNGRVIYAMENDSIGDHRLDALCLGLAGLVIEESLFSVNYRDLSTPRYIPNNETQNSNADELILKDIFDYRNYIKDKAKNSLRRSQIDRSLQEKQDEGYFSEKGLATFVKTDRKQDYDGSYGVKYTPKTIGKRRGASIKRKGF